MIQAPEWRMPHQRASRLVIAIGLAALVALPSVTAAAFAQGTGRSLDIDLSVRSSGMGGASNAVFWGGDPNHWANPALLGHHRGIAYTWGKTQLVPGLATDVFLESRRYAFGFAGVGVALAGKGPGEILLDYGASQSTDDVGNPTGTFSSFEKIDSWGFGWSLSESIRSWAALTGRPVPAIARHADFAFGFASKDLLMVLAPGFAGTGTGLDHGLLVRASPLPAGASIGGARLPVGLDLAYANSVRNYNDAQIGFGFFGSSPLTRMHRNGLAGRLMLGIPYSFREGASGAKAWLFDSVDPLVSIGVARDWEHNSAGGGENFFDVDRIGLELAVANVFTWRIGHVTDREGDIDGGTSGWGLGLRLGRVAGFRYDRATIPQARNSGLTDVKRKGFTAFVDLVSLTERNRPAPF